MTTFIFTGKSYHLSSNYNPPIYLEEDVDYEIAVVNFDSFYSIPNIDLSNNKFIWWGKEGAKHILEIPVGAYEITNLGDMILKELKKIDEDTFIRLDLDQVTSRAIVCSNRKISFQVGPVLGFTEQIVEADKSSS